MLSLPGSNEELAKKLNMDVETVNRLSLDLYKKGIIAPKDFKTLEGMRFIPAVIFLHDRTLGIGDWYKTMPLLADLWDDFMEAELFPDSAKRYAQVEQPGSRILPAYKSILDSPELLPEEDVRTILRQAKMITAVTCSCRARTGACRKIQTNVCMQFDRSAEYGLTVGMGGIGKALSYEEALAVIDAAEEAGLIHSWRNSAKMTGPTLCNCCSCCCVVGLPYLKYNIPKTKRYVKSRYEARVNPTLCVGCREEPAPPCVAICPEYFKGAIRMHGTPGASDFKATVKPDDCWGCGLCVLKCPVGAIKMELVRPADHIPGIWAPHP